MTSRLSSRNEIAADEITAFAAGAGPPENTNPTRLMWSPLRLISGQPTRLLLLRRPAHEDQMPAPLLIRVAEPECERPLRLLLVERHPLRRDLTAGLHVRRLV